ncbi:hypothetical protein BC936DRAFT_143356 [Jimgerdemannia flammicorona]|uniref:Uncharacterized protein n=1 Tax=Jimgerdemannia flammicorona TaxID=994334 RepID=A0A432ZZ06_9FUNG|nr:hypothetical protein BC936DRAFT_143356 [Jimgerdemannia flammicorona]
MTVSRFIQITLIRSSSSNGWVWQDLSLILSLTGIIIANVIARIVRLDHDVRSEKDGDDQENTKLQKMAVWGECKFYRIVIYIRILLQGCFRQAPANITNETIDEALVARDENIKCNIQHIPETPKTGDWTFSWIYKIQKQVHETQVDIHTIDIDPDVHIPFTWYSSIKGVGKIRQYDIGCIIHLYQHMDNLISRKDKLVSSNLKHK